MTLKSSQPLLAIDLFCGSGSFGKVARSLGYEVISIDNRRRVGTCEPTLKLDIQKLPGTFFKSMPVKVMWIGLPCDIWSNASGGFHLDHAFNPKTAKAKNHLDLFHKTISIIKESNPDYWFIENPRGRLHKYPDLTEFVKKYSAHIYQITLSSYGFPSKKPTIIITNYPDLKLKALDSYGRGAKNKVPGSFDNMTTVQRQETPRLLIRSILTQLP
jgi:site-specific DNA-cytosine methylase